MGKKRAYPSKRLEGINEKVLLNGIPYFIFIGCSLLFTSSSFAGSIQTCINDHGKIIFTDTGCPAGFTPKGEEKSTAKITRRDISPAPVVKKSDTMVWQNHHISLENIDMSWLLTGNDVGKEKILHPQVEFSVHNSSNQNLARMKIIVLFFNENNTLFGDTYIYTKEIGAGKYSQKVFLAPLKGFIYSGYNEEKITATRYRVDIYGRYHGAKEKIGSLDFSSKTVR